MATLGRLVACLAVALVVSRAPAIAASRSKPLDAAAATGPAWATMTMPGSIAGLCRVAGMGDMDTGRLTLELIRLLYGDRLAEGASADGTRAAILTYVDTLSAFDRAVTDSRMTELSSAAAARVGSTQRRAVLALLGIEFNPGSATPWRDLPTQPRTARMRQVLLDAGVPLADLVARLNAGAVVPLALPRVTLPLPLSARTWHDVVFRGRAGEEGLFASILRDRTAALMYHGLMSLDAETLSYLATHPSVLSVIARQHAGAFAAFGRSVHIRAGRVLVPGGPAAEGPWERLVGARVPEANEFLQALLNGGGGRVAWFYDALAHLDPPHLAFALGMPRESPPAASAAGAARPASLAAETSARLRALQSAFADIQPGWQIEAHPFIRPRADGVRLLALVRVDDRGRPVAPASLALWNRVFEDADLPSEADAQARPVAMEPAADAAALARLVLVNDSEARRRARLDTVLFAQRVFSGASPESAADVFVALRGFARFEALALTLERMGVVDPGVYVRAMRCAARLSTLGPPRRVAAALSQFQGALALVDRLVFRDVLDTADAVRLLDSLVAVPLTDEGYHGRLAAWVQAEVLPRLRARLATSAGETAEDIVLQSLAGEKPDAGPAGSPILWEDRQYRLQPATAELARLLAVRRKQGGNRLDTALALQATGDALSKATSPADCRRLASQLAALLEDLRPPAYIGLVGTPPSDSTEQLSAAARQFVASPESPARRLAAVERLMDAADDVLGDVLRSLAYAASIGDPDGNLLLGPDVAAEHDFGLVLGPEAGRLQAPWALPAEQSGAGVARHVAGSLLALDLPLAPFSLRRISSELPQQPERIDPDDELGLAHAAVLKRPWTLTDAERDEMIALLARGRERAAAATTPAARASLLDSVNADEWRRNVLEWRSQHETLALADALTLTELYWAGAAAGHAPPPGAWGASMAALTGCLCLRFIGPATIETYGLQPSGGVVSSYLSDIALRMAELTAELKLPAAVVPAAMLGVTQDVLDTARLAHTGDWLGLAEAARAVTRERFEDQVAALTVAGGPLVPVESGKLDASTPGTRSS